MQWQHEGTAPLQVRYAVDALRVSDDAWWKDFPDASRSLTPRLLPLRLPGLLDYQANWRHRLEER